MNQKLEYFSLAYQYKDNSQYLVRCLDLSWGAIPDLPEGASLVRISLETTSAPYLYSTPPFVRVIGGLELPYPKREGNAKFICRTSARFYVKALSQLEPTLPKMASAGGGQ